MAPMPATSREFFRFLLGHIAIGLLISGLVTGLLLIGDVQGLGTLIQDAEYPFLWKLILYFSLSITFCSATVGTAIMSLSNKKDD